VGPAQNRDPVSPQTGSDGCSLDLSLRKQDPAEELCPSGLLGASRHHFFESWRERKPDRPSAAPTYLAGKSQSREAESAFEEPADCAAHITAAAQKEKTAARLQSRKKRPPANETRIKCHARDTCRAFLKKY